MPTAGYRDRATAIGAALSAAANRDAPWPEHLELYDVCEELSHWLEDDRQWSQSRGGHWQSLLEDIEDSLTQLGDATSDLLNASELARQFKACRLMFEPKQPPSDLALRRRLARLLNEVAARLQPSLLLAAWRDLLSALDQAHDPEQPAAHFLSIAAWLGYSSESLRRGIESELFDGRTPVVDGKPRVDDTHATRSLEDRLDAVARRLDKPAPQGKAVVWLRYQLAKVDWEQGGFPTIAFDEAITIYQGEWLRSCVLHEQADRGLPAEIIGPDAWAFRLVPRIAGTRD
jgi:hypothetical protein